MVCQNQSIDDSDAPLARDLRVLVRERLQAGDSDRQVIDFLVARYGEFVLLKPRFSLHTALLWLGPAAVLLIGALRTLRARTPPYRAIPVLGAAGAALTPAEEARLSGDPRSPRSLKHKLLGAFPFLCFCCARQAAAALLPIISREPSSREQKIFVTHF